MLRHGNWSKCGKRNVTYVRGERGSMRSVRWQRGFRLNNVFVPHRKHSALNDRELSVRCAFLDTTGSQRGCSRSVRDDSRQTDRQVLISLAACLASSRCAALPCWRVVVSETDRASLEQVG